MSGRRFVVISGLPGRGKSTLGRALARTLGLTMIDKDEILEALFEQEGMGDAAWRTKLSRQGDRLLKQQAMASAGAVMVSHWHRAGMAEDSGTPTEWVAGLSDAIVSVNCICDVEIAAERFFKRKRHPGHLDSRSYEEVAESLRSLTRLGALEVGERVDVQTSGAVDSGAVAREIERVFRQAYGRD